jgi:adenine-specific DNA-methyltransferase
LYGIFDFIIWYAKDVKNVKYRQLYTEKEVGGEGASKYEYVELADGTRRRLTTEEKNKSCNSSSQSESLSS